jgi:hypothetical protein
VCDSIPFCRLADAADGIFILVMPIIVPLLDSSGMVPY